MKTAKLFLSPLRRKKSRRDRTLLTVCFSLQTFSLRAILLLALAFFSCANLSAQVTIGSLNAPEAGAILDLNSTVKGGLLLSNVELLNLYTIPYTGTTPFPGVTAENHESVKGDFAGALVYHIGGYNISAGIYVWNGTNWTSIEENCMPLSGNLTLTPSMTFVKVNNPVTFSVSSGASPLCVAGEEYKWYSAARSSSYSPSATATSVYPASTWTTSFATVGDYKVKVEASDRYSDPSSGGVSSNEATVYVTADGGVPSELLNGNYGISGSICYDVKGPQKNGESDNIYNDRVDAFENNHFTKTFLFYHTRDFTNLSVLMPDDPVGIVASVSQPAGNSGNGSGSVSFTVTFKDNVKQLVVDNNAPAAVKLPVTYTDNTPASKLAYLDIRVQDAGCYCPAQVPTSVHSSGWLTFMCKNLGATKDIQSVADLWAIDASNFYEYHGNWYKFGAKTVSLANIAGSEAYSSGDWDDVPYNSTDNDWPQTDDPCPSGWRLPEKSEWEAVINIANNTPTWYQGAKVNSTWGVDNDCPPSTDNYKNVLQIGDYLFLPAAGYRNSNGGALGDRCSDGYYWSSTGYNGTNDGWYMNFYPELQLLRNAPRQPHGMSVRCVRAEPDGNV
jgi:uncharacterized protein (TIGR02145 family)